MFVIPLHLQQEIAEASDDAARKYYEETLELERTGLGVTAVMRAAAKSKQQSFKGQFSKFTVVANPKFGDGFLDEVSDFFLHPSQFFLSNILESLLTYLFHFSDHKILEQQ
jgi:hypothetical protein